MKKTRIKNKHVLSFTQKLKEVGYSKVTIGGGDPLSRKKITQLLIGIKGQGLQINVDTVGTAFLNDVKTIFFGNLSIKKLSADSFIRNVDVIGIALDGSNNIVASIFRRGRKNLFNEQIEIIDLLISRGANVCVNTVMHKENYDDIINISKVLGEKKIFKWQIFQFMPIGMFGNKNKDQFLIEDSTFNKVRETITSQSFDFDVEFKSREKRKNYYLIVDDSGNAWLPTPDSKRKVLGNIKSQDDVKSICEFLLTNA